MWEPSVPLGDREPQGGPPPPGKPSEEERRIDTGQLCQAPEDQREAIHEHGATSDDLHQSQVPVLQSSRNDRGQVADLRSVTVDMQEEKIGRASCRERVSSPV